MSSLDPSGFNIPLPAHLDCHTIMLLSGFIHFFLSPNFSQVGHLPIGAHQQALNSHAVMTITPILYVDLSQTVATKLEAHNIVYDVIVWCRITLMESRSISYEKNSKSARTEKKNWNGPKKWTVHWCYTGKLCLCQQNNRNLKLLHDLIQ